MQLLVEMDSDLDQQDRLRRTTRRRGSEHHLCGLLERDEAADRGGHSRLRNARGDHQPNLDRSARGTELFVEL